MPCWFHVSKAPSKGQFRPSGEPRNQELPQFWAFLKSTTPCCASSSINSPVSTVSRDYPVGIGRASILRTMLATSRRVRWLSASINQ